MPGLDGVIAGSGGLLAYEPAARRLTVHGKLEEREYRALLTYFGGRPERAEAEPALRDLKQRSLLYVSDEDLKSLDTFARRIRGEIFFARRWMLVEGQAEYVLVSALAQALGYPLDDHGVALIDAVNNGYPPTFAVLARALGIPWLAVFDGDDAGRKYSAGIVDRGFDQAWVDMRCLLLPAGTLEQQLLADGFEPELRAILVGLGKADAATCDVPGLEKLLDKCKTDYAAVLADQVRGNAAMAARMLEPMRRSIAALRGLT